MTKTTGAKRKAISKKTRFEVFKRDSFTCQYCGKAAPDVILHVDHIDPVSKGGDNSILNLITSCAACNGGKGAIPLDDAAMLNKQRQQLAELSERREQLKMMLEWRKGMKSIDDMQLEAAKDHFSEIFQGYRIDADGALAKLRDHLRRFGLQNVMDSMEIARETYAKQITTDNVNYAWSKVGGICNNRSRPEESTVYYARGIIRKRFHYINELTALNILRNAKNAGVDDEYLKEVAKHAKNWTAWVDLMAEAIEAQK